MERQLKLVENAGCRCNAFYFLDYADIEQIEKGNNKPSAVKNRPIHAQRGSTIKQQIALNNLYEEILGPDDSDSAQLDEAKYEKNRVQQLVHTKIIGVQYLKNNTGNIVVSEKEKIVQNNAGPLVGGKDQSCMITGLNIDSVDSADSIRSSTACDISSSVFSNSRSSSGHISEIQGATADDVSVSAVSAGIVRKSGPGSGLLSFKDVACSTDFVSSVETEEDDCGGEEEDEDGEDESVDRIVNDENVTSEDACAVEIKSSSCSSLYKRFDQVVETIFNKDVNKLTMKNGVGVESRNDIIAPKKKTNPIQPSIVPAIQQNQPSNSIPGSRKEQQKKKTLRIPVRTGVIQDKASIRKVETGIENIAKFANPVSPLKSRNAAYPEISKSKQASKPDILQKDKDIETPDVSLSTKQRIDVSTQAIFDSENSSKEKSDLSSPESSSNLESEDKKMNDYTNCKTDSHLIEAVAFTGNTLSADVENCIPVCKYKTVKIVEADITKATRGNPDVLPIRSPRLTTNRYVITKYKHDKPLVNGVLGIHGWSENMALSLSSSAKDHEKFHSKLMKSLHKSKALCNKFALTNKQVKSPTNENTHNPFMIKSFQTQKENQTETGSPLKVKATAEEQKFAGLKERVIFDGIAKENVTKLRKNKSPTAETSRPVCKRNFYSSNTAPFSVKTSSPNWNTPQQDRQCRNTSLSPTRKNASKRYRYTPIFLTPRIKDKPHTRYNHSQISKKAFALRTQSFNVPKMPQSFVERLNFVKQFSSSIREMNKGKNQQLRLDSWNKLTCHRIISNQTGFTPQNNFPLSYCHGYIEGNNNIYIRDNGDDDAKVTMAATSRIIPMSKNHSQYSDGVL